MDQVPERPIECGECKKPVAVVYTELVGKTMYRISMCADCPMLRQKLYGSQSFGLKNFGSSTESCNTESMKLGLCCGNCNTTADEVRMGSSVGCSTCYEVFEDLLAQELTAQNVVVYELVDPHQEQHHKKHPVPLHLGRQPGQTTQINPSLKLMALHQALNETLSREDYEQAAWLRDQIKALTEGNDEQKPA